MDSKDLTTDQCREMHGKLFPLANYLSRVVKRMDKRGFPADDKLYVSARTGYDAVCDLLMEMHYHSC